MVRRCPSWLFALALLASWISPSAAQLPEEFTNLQIFPKDIDPKQLVGVMKSFTDALGVRCDFCHTATGESFDTFDWPSDAKPQKQKAREMMKLVQYINDDVVPKVAEDANDPVKVKCVTCHRGQQSPRQIGDVLERARAEGGFEAMEARYTELRQKYFGSDTFDFSESMLPNLADQQLRAGNVDDAIAILSLNLQSYPGSSFTYGMLGQAYAQKDDTKAAIEALEKALELDPENDWAKRMLGRLKG